MNYDVIVYGTIALDAIWRVAELPPPGGYAPILEERKMIGGEACNTAIALTRWGVRVALIGNAIGDDEHGRLLRELLARDAPDLDTRFIRTLPDAHTPYCVCIATPDGERTMYGTSFYNWQCAELDPDLARSARVFTMEPNAWEPGRQAAQVAASAGASVIAMDYTRDPVINRLATINLTSHTEAPGPPTGEAWREYATHLRDAYGPTAIVTCGPQGCFVAESGRAGRGRPRSRLHCAYHGGRHGLRRRVPSRAYLRAIAGVGFAQGSAFCLRGSSPELRRDGRVGRRPLGSGNRSVSTYSR